jgi:hypothetical protein
MTTTVQPIIRNFADTTVIVSRAQRFYDYPRKIFPVSCTNVSLVDAYFDDDLDIDGEPIHNFYETIGGSHVYVRKVLKGNAGVVIDLSEIRPKGTEGSNGMVTAGVANFMAAYSQDNLEIRRGSAFRNGAVVLQLDADHPDLEDFLNMPAKSIPWAKRGVTVKPGWIEKPYYPLIEDALAKGEIFVYKQKYDANGNPLKINVCQGILFLSRSTCTLAHINLGKIKTYTELEQAFIKGAWDMDTIWKDFYDAWRGEMGYEMKRSASHFLNPARDKQVGLGVLGLANMLGNFEVKYADFAEALDVLTKQQENDADYFHVDDPSAVHLEPKARGLAIAFTQAYRRAADFFRAEGYLRAFTIEPTATCAYKQRDFMGYVTSPEISPPIAHPLTKIGRRQVDEGFTDFQYPHNIEVAGHNVPWQVYDQLCRAWQRMMNNTGLAHSISYNWWLSKPVNRETLEEWDESELISIYYRWKEKTDDADKTNIGITVDAASEEFWSLEDGTEEAWVEPEGVICQLNSGGCTSCG